jgi:hypothetical protein
MEFVEEAMDPVFVADPVSVAESVFVAVDPVPVEEKRVVEALAQSVSLPLDSDPELLLELVDPPPSCVDEDEDPLGMNRISHSLSSRTRFMPPTRIAVNLITQSSSKTPPLVGRVSLVSTSGGPEKG